MGASTVNISFPRELLEQADRVAKRESRSRSELVREALRAYLDRRLRWDAVFGLGDARREAGNLTEEEVESEIAAHRAEKRQRS
ncbi:MAG: ribbon-helix-helix protein, CopG family [Polyangia bacterium]